jgi:hypothetical protein
MGASPYERDDFSSEDAEDSATPEPMVRLPSPRAGGAAGQSRRKIERLLELRRLKKEIQDYGDTADEL